MSKLATIVLMKTPSDVSSCHDLDATMDVFADDCALGSVEGKITRKDPFRRIIK